MEISVLLYEEDYGITEVVRALAQRQGLKFSHYLLHDNDFNTILRPLGSSLIILDINKFNAEWAELIINIQAHDNTTILLISVNPSVFDLCKMLNIQLFLEKPFKWEEFNDIMLQFATDANARRQIKN